MQQSYLFYDKASAELWAEQVQAEHNYDYCVDMGDWYLMPHLKVVAPYSDGNCYEAQTLWYREPNVIVQFQDGEKLEISPWDLTLIPGEPRPNHQVKKLIHLATRGLPDPIFQTARQCTERTLVPVDTSGLSQKVTLAFRHPERSLVVLANPWRDTSPGRTLDETVLVTSPYGKFNVQRKDLWLVYPNSLVLSLHDMLTSFTSVHGTVTGPTTYGLKPAALKREQEVAKLGRTGDKWFWIWHVAGKFGDRTHVAFVPAARSDLAVIRAKQVWGHKLQRLLPHIPKEEVVEVHATECIAPATFIGPKMLTLTEARERENQRIADEWEQFRSEMQRMNPVKKPLIIKRVGK